MFEICMVCVPLPGILMVFYYVVPVIMSPMLSSCYVSDCPTTSEIKQRSLQHPCPENKAYHILWDPEIKKYAERCLISQPVPPGNAIMLDQSGSIHTEACWEGTFQPDYYRSNTQCACNETKGHCNKTGQLIASNGNTTHDRTCRCDFKRGYKISTTPSNNECVCLSSNENCTCIKEECKTGYRLSPDDECVLEKLFSTTDYTCKDYITSEESTTQSVPDSDTSISLESTTESVPDSGTSKRVPTCTVQCYVTAIITICTALVVIIVFCGAVIFGKKKMIKIISCICAPMRICCKKCRPGRNGSADTDNEGTSKGKDSDPVQETDSDAMLSNIKADETD